MRAEVELAVTCRDLPPVTQADWKSPQGGSIWFFKSKKGVGVLAGGLDHLDNLVKHRLFRVDRVPAQPALSYPLCTVAFLGKRRCADEAGAFAVSAHQASSLYLQVC